MQAEDRGGRRAEIGRERRERTRIRIVSAAARAVANHGEHRVTIDDFITEAGVARGTFYNYFTTREALIDSLWAYVGKQPFVEIQRLCAGLDDPAERIVTELRLVARRAAVDETWGWLVFSMSGERTVNEDLLTFPAPDLASGLSAGRFRFEQLASARDLVVATARAALRASLERRATEAYLADTCRLLLRALGVDEIESRRLSSLPLPAPARNPADRPHPVQASPVA